MNSPTLQNDSSELLSQWGLLLSAITYGAHISLSAISLRPIWQRRQRVLLLYTILLFILATIGFGLQSWWTTVAFITNRDYPGGPNQFLLDNVHSPANTALTMVYILLNWFSDGIILYRFYMLCACDLAHGNRWKALLFVIPSSLALSVMGIVCLPQIAGLGVNLWTDISAMTGIAYMALSLTLNTTLTLLIIVRLLLIRRRLRACALPEASSTYTSVVALLIESAALYTTVALLAVVACGVNSPMQYVLLPMLGQLQAIPPLLITSRLAAGFALSESTYKSVLDRQQSKGPSFKRSLSRMVSRLEIHVDTSVQSDAPKTASSAASSAVSVDDFAPTRGYSFASETRSDSWNIPSFLNHQIDIDRLEVPEKVYSSV